MEGVLTQLMKEATSLKQLPLKKACKDALGRTPDQEQSFWLWQAIVMCSCLVSSFHKESKLFHVLSKHWHSSMYDVYADASVFRSVGRQFSVCSCRDISAEVWPWPCYGVMHGTFIQLVSEFHVDFCSYCIGGHFCVGLIFMNCTSVKKIAKIFSHESVQ